jgi:hypothetical protein
MSSCIWVSVRSRFFGPVGSDFSRCVYTYTYIELKNWVRVKAMLVKPVSSQVLYGLK